MDSQDIPGDTTRTVSMGQPVILTACKTLPAWCSLKGMGMQTLIQV